MTPFYLYGRLIAVLEQGGRGHDDIQWLELYYPRGFFPWVGLTGPLQKHRQSVLPFLTRQGRTQRYVNRLNALATALQPTADQQERFPTFDSWSSGYLSDCEDRRPQLPATSTPRDASHYAQGYLDERFELQPNRPQPPQDEDLWQFCWDYHQGRLLTWNIAGNHPRLSPGIQLGIADRRALTAPKQKGAAR